MPLKRYLKVIMFHFASFCGKAQMCIFMMLIETHNLVFFSPIGKLKIGIGNIWNVKSFCLR